MTAIPLERFATLCWLRRMCQTGSALTQKGLTFAEKEWNVQAMKGVYVVVYMVVYHLKHLPELHLLHSFFMAYTLSLKLQCFYVWLVAPRVAPMHQFDTTHKCRSQHGGGASWTAPYCERKLRGDAWFAEDFLFFYRFPTVFTHLNFENKLTRAKFLLFLNVSFLRICVATFGSSVKNFQDDWII